MAHCLALIMGSAVSLALCVTAGDWFRASGFALLIVFAVAQRRIDPEFFTFNPEAV